MYQNEISYASGKWKWFKPTKRTEDINFQSLKLIKESIDLDKILEKNKVKLDLKKVKIL